MQTKKLLNWAGLLALGYLILEKVGLGVANKISVGRVKVRFGSFDFSSLGISLDLEIPLINNTAVSIPVDSFSAVLLFNNSKLVDVVMSQPRIIEANEISVLSAEVPIQFGQGAQQVMQLIQSMGTGWKENFRIQGVIHSSGLSIPFNQGIQVL